MASASLVEMPKELISQVFDYLTPSELCQPARACETLNILCETLVYQNVPVVNYSYSLVKTPDYHGIRSFFQAIKKRPRRLSYIKRVSARLELRLDCGIYHACELFEALPKMPQLTELSLEIVGGISNRENRPNEQGFVSRYTFERGRMAMYKFFRLPMNNESGGHIPAASIPFPTDQIFYSALQHKSVTRLKLKHVVNASLAAPKLPGASGAITHLTMQACRLPPKAYQSIFQSISALQHFDYRAAGRTGGLGPGGLVNVLAHHSRSLQSLSIKTGADEMVGMDLSTFTKLTHLQVHNADWNEDAMEVDRPGWDALAMLAVFPPYLDTLTLQNYHPFGFIDLVEWMNTTLVTLKCTRLPHLKAIRLEGDRLDKNRPYSHPMLQNSASAIRVDPRALALGTRLYREAGIKLSVKDTLYLGLEGQAPGPYDMGPEPLMLRLSWEHEPQCEDSEDMARRVEVDMSPKGAVEKFLFSQGRTLRQQLSS